MRSDATRKPDPLTSRPGGVSSGAESKKVRKVPTRRISYRVGYSWNKGGRLKELRIRHLARKFLKIWIRKTFGRILPHRARFHYDSLVLKRAFEGWRDEWWTSRREWSLTMRAECHHRYHLYNLAFYSWRTFMSLQREKKLKIQNALLFAERQRLRLVWDRWEVFIEMGRMKSRMRQSALEQNRLATLRSVWSLWQARLQQHEELYALEDQAHKQRTLTLQSRAWLQWKDRHSAACCQKEKESSALLHYILILKRKTLHHWKTSVFHLKTKKESQVVAQRACHRHLLMVCWSKWSSALHHKRREEDRLLAVEHLAARSSQHRALERWRVYVTLCREEAERNRTASQHYLHHLLRAGLQGLSLNITWNKTQRLNNNMAVQHYHQTVIRKYWLLWQDRQEEAEDKSCQPLTEMALSYHSTSLLSSCFHHWREKLAEYRHMKELEHRADVWFSECMLPRCLKLWVQFTLQRRLHKQRKRKAEVYNQQRQYSRAFYTWWERSERHKEQMLFERMAVLHEERCHLQRAWVRWSQRTEQQINEEEKREASDRLYLHRLLHKTMTQWKDNSTETRDRRNREQQACHRGDLCRMKWAVEKWKKFVHSQRVKKSRLKQTQHHHELKLLNRTFVAWKTHHLQMSHISAHVEELHRQQEQNLLRKVVSIWRENAMLLSEVRLMEQRAQNHFHHFLQLKVFLLWRKATINAVSQRRQQREAVSRAQRSINQVRLLQSFRQWRKQTTEARRERISMEKARLYHQSRLLSKAMKVWLKHHDQYQKNKIMKRQGIFLLRLKMYQTYFEQWRLKLQRRHREAKQTERALWHWSLTLQAKVLNGWRLWVTEQRRKQEQAARAAQIYRDQLLREGVTCILTYAAHMNDLTTSLTQHSQEQRSRHLQRVVRRCATRWKQRALCKPRREPKVKGQPLKKSVTFSLTTPGLSVSPSDSVDQEAEDGVLSKLLLNRMPRRPPRRRKELFESLVKINTPVVTSTETSLKPSQLSCPSQEGLQTVSPCLNPAGVPVPSTHQRITISNASPSEPHMGSPEQNQDVLLPPSAFMNSRTEDSLVPPFKQHSSAHPDVQLRASSVETVEGAAVAPTSALIGELLSIQLDMKTYQQDRKQLRAWQKLKEVLQRWLQTSGKDEQMEKKAVCEELKELEERIDRLSTDLAKRKPMMLLHAERIHRLQTVLTEHRVFIR